jgi:FtsH-binding integral membrane protein
MKNVDWDIVKQMGFAILTLILILAVLIAIPWALIALFGKVGWLIVFVEWSVVGTWSLTGEREGRDFWSFMTIGTFCGLLFWALMALCMWSTIHWPTTTITAMMSIACVGSLVCMVVALKELYKAIQREKQKESDRPSDSETE